MRLPRAVLADPAAALGNVSPDIAGSALGRTLVAGALIEEAVPQAPSAEILCRIDRLRGPPVAVA